jgi:hypothetical protein
MVNVGLLKRVYRQMMTDDTPKHKPVQWQQPAQRMALVYVHHVTCERCGKEFTVENAMPIPPRYCSKEINPACYTARRTEAQRRYRENAKSAEGEVDKE